MDILLGTVTQQAINYAIRSGLAVTGGFAMKQCSRLLQSTPRGSKKDDLRSLQSRLESKISIISPAIDMIELIAARGNTSLESAVQLTKDIRWEIQSLGVRLAGAANDEELFRRGSQRAKPREQITLEVELISADMRNLLTRIEDAVPLINLAITTSGVNLSTNLPASVSPSRLLQASTLLTAADGRYGETGGQRVQVGPTYILSMYMLFAGHAWRPRDDEEIRATTWKEVIHKARVKLVRLPLAQLYDLPKKGNHVTGASSPLDSHSIPADDATAEYSYQLLLIEDFDDDRMHTFDDSDKQPSPFEDVPTAGIRDVIPIHQISKIFYADTGKILNIGSDGETNSPVLLLKRDIYAEPPRRMMERRGSASSGTMDGILDDPGDDFSEDEDQCNVDRQIRRESGFVEKSNEHDEPREGINTWRLPPDLDPEWIAFEVYTEASDSESEEENEGESDTSRGDNLLQTPFEPLRGAVSPDLSKSLSGMRISDTPTTQRSQMIPQEYLEKEPQLPIKTSLSLLEMLIRLTALQQFRQASHLTIEDELLNFFLADSSTTGAGSNAEHRQRVRRDARRRLGFDPYDESPMKRRGEEYIAHHHPSPGNFSYHDEQPGAGFESPARFGPSIESSIRKSTSSSRFAQSSPSPYMAALRPHPLSTRSSPIPSTPARGKPISIYEKKSRRHPLRSQSENPSIPSPLRPKSQLKKRDSTLGKSLSFDEVEAPKDVRDS